MIALLVLLSLSVSTKSQLSSCLKLEIYEKDYQTDFSECHKRVFNPDADVQYEGKGTFGSVHSCEIKTEKNESIKIAVKITKPQFPSRKFKEKHKALADNELIMLDNLNRLGNIWLPLYYGCIYDSTKNTVYIVMEHLDTTVSQALMHSTSEVSKLEDLHVLVLQSMLQLARGVEGLHEIGLAHNDLHMNNIMLDTHSNVAKLIDFGTVCIADEAKYNEAAKYKNLKNEFNMDLGAIDCASKDSPGLKKDIGDLFSIFTEIMTPILNKPTFVNNDSSSAANEEFKKDILSIFNEHGGELTITSIVTGLENMLKKKKDDELLNKDEFSKNYYLRNAEKFKLDLFQLKPKSESGSELGSQSESGSKDKRKFESFEELKEKVVELEKTTECKKDCKIFRRILI